MNNAALNLSGRKVGELGLTGRVSGGSLSLSGRIITSPPQLGDRIALTPGSLSVVGQILTIDEHDDVVLSPGSISVQGQSLNLVEGTSADVVSITPGTVVVTGASVSIVENFNADVISISPGTVVPTGKTISIVSKDTIQMSPGSVSVVGQTVSIVEGVAASAAPTIKAITSSSSSDNETAHDVPAPAGISAGDLWVVVVCLDGAEDIVAPSVDWTEVLSTNRTSGEFPGMGIYTKVADGTETTEEFTWGTGEKGAFISFITDDGVVDTADTSNGGGNVASLASPSVTIAENDSLVIQFGFGDDNGSATVTFQGGIPSGTDIGVTPRSSAAGGCFLQAVTNEEDAGSSTAGTWNYGTSGSRPLTAAVLVLSPE